MRRRAGAGGGDEERGPTSDDSAIDEAAEVPDGDEELAIVVERAPGPRRRRLHLDPGSHEPRLIAARALRRPADTEGTTPERRFAAALLHPADEMGAPADAAVLRQLASAAVVGAGRIPYASNAVFVLELDAPAPSGSGRLRAVYKPARGERPLWDFPPHTLHFRETATYVVDAALGFGLVPPTVLREGPHGPGSVQLLIRTAGRSLGGAPGADIAPAILAMAALDVLANNADRKSAHLLVTADGRLIGIDHGLTFLPYPRQRTVLAELGGALLPDAVATAVRTLDSDAPRRATLLRHLGRLLAPAEVEAFSGRLRELAADPVYPELDPWDGRPFEWW